MRDWKPVICLVGLMSIAVATRDAQAEDKTTLQATVMLGSPELTAGIPGQGPLTAEQIKKWLADAANHQPLEVELPLGLDVGRAGIQIPEGNPLTRAKIELGRQLYFDPRLSVDGTVSCASCHAPDQGYGAHTRFGIGVRGQKGGRNSPVSYNRILSNAQFWDGRAASLEEQAKGPIANPIEMANTHEACIECLKQNVALATRSEGLSACPVLFPSAGCSVRRAAASAS